MEVALVYNMKKEKSDVADSDIEPSSQNITDVSTQIVEKATSADTYAEWDTIETVTAVRDALALRHSITMVEADEDAYAKLRSGRPEIVFNIAEDNTVSRGRHKFRRCWRCSTFRIQDPTHSPSLFV